jgi:hypothetical protein
VASEVQAFMIEVSEAFKSIVFESGAFGSTTGRSALPISYMSEPIYRAFSLAIISRSVVRTPACTFVLAIDQSLKIMVRT